MPQASNPQQASKRVPEEYGQTILAEIENYSKHEDFRKKVKEIINEVVDTNPFAKKIKEYASEEIDKRIYQNIGFWVSSQ